MAHAFLEGAPAPAGVSSVTIPGVPVFAHGKVRDIFDLGDHLLLVATDRLSAYDVVMNEPIPGKGIVLTALSEFWFQRTASIVPNHYVATDVRGLFAGQAGVSEERLAGLQGRSMLVRKAKRIDIECVVRGYLAGSGWAEYRQSGTCIGHRLPSGLKESARLPEPIFTPATKAETGHDMNISTAEMANIVGT